VLLAKVADFFLTTFAIEAPDAGQASVGEPHALGFADDFPGTDSIGCFSSSSCMSLIPELVENHGSIEVILAICLMG